MSTSLAGLGRTMPGPVAYRFLNARSWHRLIVGPVGGGKTTTVFLSAIIQAARARPSPLDGWRRFKLLVVRANYRELWRSTIPSWQKHFPEDMPGGSWVGGRGGPANHQVKIDLGNGRILFTVDFAAVGENQSEEAIDSFFRGYEPTALYINELDTLPKDVFTLGSGRCGRYPTQEHGFPEWYGVYADSNAPDIDNWVYQEILEPEDHGGWDRYRQPGARSPGAENLHNLPPGYYENQMRGKEDWWIKRFIDCQSTMSRDGLPVYEDFNEDWHVSKTPLEPVPGRQIIIGLDAGLTPAASFQQHLAVGQKRVIDEISTTNCGASQFGRLIALKLAEKYPEWSRARSAGGRPAVLGAADPSAFSGERGEDWTWVQKVSAAAGIPIFPAAMNNAPEARRAAIREPLKRSLDGRAPEFLVSSDCPVHRRALAGGFHYVKVAGVKGAAIAYHVEPAKNQWSHTAEACEYAAMYGGGAAEVDAQGRRTARAEGRRQTTAVTPQTPEGRFAEGGRGFARR